MASSICQIGQHPSEDPMRSAEDAGWSFKARKVATAVAPAEGRASSQGKRALRAEREFFLLASRRMGGDPRWKARQVRLELSRPLEACDRSFRLPAILKQKAEIVRRLHEIGLESSLSETPAWAAAAFRCSDALRRDWQTSGRVLSDGVPLAEELDGEVESARIHRQEAEKEARPGGLDGPPGPRGIAAGPLRPPRPDGCSSPA